MKLHILVEKDHIQVQERAEGDGLVGDYRERVYPGQGILGYSYEELRALGNGSFDLTPKKQPG